MSERYEQIKHELDPVLRELHERLIARLDAIEESWRNAPTKADWDRLLAETIRSFEPDRR